VGRERLLRGLVLLVLRVGGLDVESSFSMVRSLRHGLEFGLLDRLNPS
jgi:hypothetical protein